MRILFGSTPASGHVRPGLPVVRELVARGHEVLFYTGGRFRELVERSGARHVPFQHGLEFDEADLDTTFPERATLRAGLPQLRFDIRNVFIEPVAGHLADLRALLARERVDAVVVDSAFVGGGALAEREGIPWAVYGTIPLTARSVDTAPMGLGLTPLRGPAGRVRNAALNVLVERGAFGALQRRAVELFAEQDLGPLRSFFLNYTADTAPVYIQGTIPEFEYPRRDMPPNVRFVGALLPEPPGSGLLPDWWSDLDGSRPVVLVTQGTVKVDPTMLLYPAIEALAGEDVLVVGTTGGFDVADVPDRYRRGDVRLERFLPFADLLPRVDAMVTNGGYGGTQQALAHGIPVVAAGMTEGKNEVAARVGWSGAGVNLRSERPSPERIRAAVDRVLTEPSYRDRARALADRYATHDAPVTSADLIEALVA